MDSTDYIAKSSGSSTPLEDNINVVVRVRPLNDREHKARDVSITQFPGSGQLLVSLHQLHSIIICYSIVVTLIDSV